jgi:outer membrane protein assembly factor BamE (lipoprotein component of BamABCDE complex)
MLYISFLISAFFVGYWLKRKGRLKFSLKLFSYSGVLFFMGVLLYLILILTVCGIQDHFSNRDFNKETWSENMEGRYEMYKDLATNKKGLFLNKSKEDVQELLGTPFYSDDSLYYYYLGVKPGLFAIDPEFLIIEFDAVNKSNNFYLKRFG